MNFHLQSLQLKNFRCFAEAEISFEPDLTVLVAPNGGGKSAWLDAVALAMRLFTDRLRGAGASQGFQPRDVRRALHVESGTTIQTYPVEFQAVAKVAETRIGWKRALNTSTSRTTTASAQQIDGLAQVYRIKLEKYVANDLVRPPELPVVAYYGTGRIWRTLKLSERKAALATSISAPLSAYEDCLNPASSFAQFEAWLERMTVERSEERDSDAKSPHQPLQQIRAVRLATDEILAPSGWSRIAWSAAQGGVVMSHPTRGRLPVSMLSDGIRNAVAIAGDLAHRCVRLNRHWGSKAPSRTPGIVLIDEIDLHLHPEWQQTIIRSLRAAFPRIQFIVTTHSPQVLSTVDKRCIRVLHADGTVTTPQQQTKGVESPKILATVMGVDPIPPVEEAVWVRDYQALIETERGDTPEALELRAKIITHFGERHQVVLDCERLLRWQKFHQQRAAAKREG
jgi:predicted ATP-binding protein involved in virulence